jgi:murein DD-endopeptidase MepM/ murein hydrolase activator NlpD
MRFKKLLAAAALSALAILPSAAQTAERPMVMPAAQPAGRSTWLFGGAYGNTPGAFNNADEWYRAGQGLHFGVDLSMPCGTELVAVADGVVAFVDDLGFGAGPHNIILRHDALGVTTLYGHTSPERIVRQGQTVTQGEIIGYSGDPDSTCFSRPHLHFEVRSLDYQTTYNPVDWIDANWHTLALVGAFSDRMFQGDMDNPSRWMSLEDQPEVRFFGQRLNNYSAVYPPARGEGGPASAPAHRELPPLDLTAQWTARTIGSGRCCWQNFWHPVDPDGLYSIDGMSGQRAQVVRWTLDAPRLDTPIEAAPPSHKSPDWTWRIALQGEEALLTNSENGTEFRYNTGGEMPSLSADNSRLLWIDTRPTAPGQPRSPATVIVAELSSGAVNAVYEAPGASAQWIDGARLLFTTPGDNRTTTYSVFDTRDGSLFGLGTWSWSRGANVGPGGDWVILYVTNQPDPANSGVYAIRTVDGAQPVKLPWFGSWRWRDSDELYIIPMDVTTSVHTLHHFDLATGTMTPLNTPEFSVMNGEWNVNADGTKLAYRELTTNELTLLEISE